MYCSVLIISVNDYESIVSSCVSCVLCINNIEIYIDYVCNV